MSKLIYSQTSALIEGTYDGIKNRDQAVNPVYYSVAFTGDGFLYTHGRKFRLFNVINDAIEGLSFQVSNGLAGVYIDGTSLGTGNVIQAIIGDGIVIASTTNGVTSIGHATTLTQQQTGSYGSATQIPIITVNEGGHITAISNSSTIDISKIRADVTTTTGQYHPVGVTDDTLQNPLYHSNFYFDGSGNVYGNNFYLNNQALSAIFAPLTHTSVEATDIISGHVLLYDSADNAKDVTAATAATPKAVYAAINTANQYAQNLFAAQDAMVFIGTMNASGVITSHNNDVANNVTDGTTTLEDLDYKVGWTLRFVTAGTYQGEDVEVGDMIIAVKKRGVAFAITDWTIIQTNISGALTATSNLSGLLYASNSRVINALAFSTGILRSDGSSVSFVNPNTIWRNISVDSTSIGTNALNLVSGANISLSNVGGTVTISANNSDIISTASYLNIEQGNVKFRYKPSAEATLTVDNSLSLTVNNGAYSIGHASGNTFTNKLGSITTDSYGHITSITEVSTLANPYSLILKNNAGTSFLEYSGSTAKTLVFANGTDISFATSTNLSNEIVITPSITHRYRPIQFYPSTDSQSATPLLANNVNTTFTLIGGTNVSITNVNSLGENLPNGTLMINAEDTWRDIQAYKFQSNVINRSSIQDAAMKFSDDFLYSSEELGIMWTEIDDNGNVTYVK